VALLHHVNVGALRAAFLGLRKDAAAGVDGVTWETYASGLDERLLDLHERVHAGTYRAPPSRRVYIPKEDGGQRPLGIAALEDKIVQKAVTDTILVPIYETDFLNFSHGFRPGRSAHDALDALTVGIERRKVNWVVDLDIRAFFDTVSREWMLRFLQHRIGDRRVLRLIGKWLSAGVMDGGDWTDTGKGTPQGAIVSAVLANVYLHYVLDLWFHRKWRRHYAVGDTIIVRYADDVVVGLQDRRNAGRFLRDLRERLARFGLELHPDKTRLLEFGRHARARRQLRGEGKPETFDFLGMTHYCAMTLRGGFRMGRRPMTARMNRTLRRIKEVLRRRWHDGEHELAAWLGRVLAGWLNYFAVPGSSVSLQRFQQRLRRLFLRALRRRSQKDRTAWARLGRLIRHHWAPLHIRHPWPGQRLAVCT
jgi:group II intron reverse transcriptase/maturase